jgi:hypothetical protein
MADDLQRKTSPVDMARGGVLAGIARGDEEIFPDPWQQPGELRNKSHKEFERAAQDSEDRMSSGPQRGYTDERTHGG